MITARIDVPVVITDGGRAAAGFATGTDAGDCVVRAIALATGRDYRRVYDDLADRNAAEGRPRSARDGNTPRKVYDAYLTDDVGWTWTPTMQIGSGCQVHLRPDELPDGRLVARLTRHLCAVIDGVVYDNHDPSRGGTRCVYGYWREPKDDR